MKDIADFTYVKDLDVLILAECTISAATIASNLSKSHTKRKFTYLKNTNSKFKIVTRLDGKCIKNFDKKFGGFSWSINKFLIPNIVEFSIVSVHLPSKLHWDDSSQTFEAVNMMNQVRDYERYNGKNTIIIGDFNMNPYEAGMTSTLGLHGMKDATIAKEKNRKVQGKLYDYLYNPMWNYLGDDNDVPGTYFKRKAVHNNVMWNTFDQILVRPNLLNYFKIEDIEIVTHIGSESLIDVKTKKIKETYSDHLPIIITLKL